MWYDGLLGRITQTGSGFQREMRSRISSTMATRRSSTREPKTASLDISPRRRRAGSSRRGACRCAGAVRSVCTTPARHRAGSLPSSRGPTTRQGAAAVPPRRQVAHGRSSHGARRNLPRPPKKLWSSVHGAARGRGRRVDTQRRRRAVRADERDRARLGRRSLSGATGHSALRGSVPLAAVPRPLRRGRRVTMLGRLVGR